MSDWSRVRSRWTDERVAVRGDTPFARHVRGGPIRLREADQRCSRACILVVLGAQLLADERSQLARPQRRAPSCANGKRSSCRSLHHWYGRAAPGERRQHHPRERLGTSGFTPAGEHLGLAHLLQEGESLSPVNSLRPQISSHSKTPAAKTSPAMVERVPRTCSGLM